MKKNKFKPTKHERAVWWKPPYDKLSLTDAYSKRMIRWDMKTRSRRDSEYSKTSGHQKLKNYFTQVTKTEYFQDTVEKLRKKYGIPLKGYKDTSYTMPPVAWRNEKRKDLNSLYNDLLPLCKKYALHHADFSEIISFYIIYNKMWISSDGGICNLVHIHDITEEKRDPLGKWFTNSDDFAYPIGIRFSPYAEKRDLLDFIERMYAPSIEPIQLFYRDPNIRIGRVREKSKRGERVKTAIYKLRVNKHLKYKEIARIIYKKYSILYDVGTLSKIVSLESRVRT